MEVRKDRGSEPPGRNEAESAGTLCGPLNKNGPHGLRDLNAQSSGSGNP